MRRAIISELASCHSLQAMLECSARSAPPGRLNLVLCAAAEPGGLGDEVAPFRNAGGATGGQAVVLEGSLAVAGHFEQMGPHCVEAMMPGHAGIGIERGHELDSLGGAMHHGGGDGVVQQHHGILGGTLEQVVERQDLRPIGLLGARRFVVYGGDGGPKLVGANRSLGEGGGEKGGALANLSLVPEGPVLLSERNQFLAGSGAGRAAGVGQQHQGEQAGRLRVVG